MNIEEKLNDLDKRLAALEKVEKRRKIMARINLGFKAVLLVVLVIVFFKAYSYLKTFKEKIDQIQSIEDKLNVTETFLQEQLDNLNKFNPFN